MQPLFRSLYPAFEERMQATRSSVIMKTITLRKLNVKPLQQPYTPLCPWWVRVVTVSKKGFGTRHLLLWAWTPDASFNLTGNFRSFTRNLFPVTWDSPVMKRNAVDVSTIYHFLFLIWNRLQVCPCQVCFGYNAACIHYQDWRHARRAKAPADRWAILEFYWQLACFPFKALNYRIISADGCFDICCAGGASMRVQASE